jgi:hypothetical protein
VNDQVKAKLGSRPQQHRGDKGGVNHARQAMLLGERDHTWQVRHLHQGVADRLNIHHLQGATARTASEQLLLLVLLLLLDCAYLCLGACASSARHPSAFSFVSVDMQHEVLAVQPPVPVPPCNCCCWGEPGSSPHLLCHKGSIVGYLLAVFEVSLLRAVASQPCIATPSRLRMVDCLLVPLCSFVPLCLFVPLCCVERDAPRCGMAG